MTYWSLTSLDEAFLSLAGFSPLPAKPLTLANSLGYALAEPVVAPEDLPPFTRSSMDGYAVRSAEVAGASESSPVYLEVTGQIPMGTLPSFSLSSGQAAPISTGGALPGGADAVVMVEYTSLLPDGRVEIRRGAAGGENLIRRGDDVKAGQPVLQAGRRLRPQDIGALAGLGITEVAVYPLPRVGIFSTGDELVLPEQTPPPGKIRNINLSVVTAVLSRMGVEVNSYGILPDQKEAIVATLKQAVAENDLVIITGGSSKGVRDYAIEVIDQAGPPGVIHHGLAIRPGKPTIIGASGSTPVIGLPGHPASSYVVLQLLVCPLVRILSGENLPPESFAATRGKVVIQAVLDGDAPSVLGREDFVRVSLDISPEGYRAKPVFGDSGLIRTLVEADGLLPIPAEREGYDAGEKVRILLLEAGF